MNDIQKHTDLKNVENMAKEEMIESMKIMEDTIIRQYIQLTQSYVKPHTCTFCENPESILTKDTCCNGCSKL